jgi:hypothetical protein
MKFISHLILIILVLILVFQVVIADSSSTVSVNFEVKDGGGNPLKDSLVIIQGITNTGFSESKLTDSGGKTSFNLDKDNLFIYIVYKLSYKEQTDSFSTFGGNKNFQITMEKLPDDQWFFYLLNNGEIEFQFKSLDDSTNYKPGDYLKGIFEIKNVAGKNIELLVNKSSFLVVDSQTLNAINGWGNLKPSNPAIMGISAILKSDGWVRGTLSEGVVEVCIGNIIIDYQGQKVELSGDESICESDAQDNKIPNWILTNKYRMDSTYFYKIDGIEKQINVISQEFFINNAGGEPNNLPIITSMPITEVNESSNYLYQVIATDSDGDVLNYSFTQNPDWLSISGSGLITGISPNITTNTNYPVAVRVSDSTDFATQTFNLVVKDTSVIIPPDTTPPIITVVSPSSNQMFNVSNILFNITTNENASNAWYILNAGSNISMNQNSATSYSNTIILTDGNYSVIFYAKDLAGNIGQSSPVNFSINTTIIPPDTTSPEINIISPINGINYTSHITEINYTTMDANLASCWYTLDNGVTNITTICNTLITGISSVQGTNTWTVYANDTAGNTASQRIIFDINIPVLNNPPVITSSPVTSVNETATYSYQVAVADADNDTLTYSLTTAPGWLSINSATGAIIGTTPDVTVDTNYAVTVSVSDGIDNVTQNYILIVKMVNNAPRITSIAVTSINEGQDYIYQVNASDANNDSLTYSLIQSPNWLSINSDIGLITGIAPNVDSNTNYLITINVSDGKSFVTQTFNLTIKDIPVVIPPNTTLPTITLSTSRTKKNIINFFSKDELYEQKYLDQFKVPKTIIFYISATDVPATGSLKSMLKAIDQKIDGSTILFLMMLNLNILLLIILVTLKN